MQPNLPQKKACMTTVNYEVQRLGNSPRVMVSEVTECACEGGVIGVIRSTMPLSVVQQALPGKYVTKLVEDGVVVTAWPGTVLESIVEAFLLDVSFDVIE